VRKPKARQKAAKHPYTGRQSKIGLEAWVHIMSMMIAEITSTWPPKQQIQVLDGLLQAIVQRLNWLRDRNS